MWGPLRVLFGPGSVIVALFFGIVGLGGTALAGGVPFARGILVEALGTFLLIGPLTGRSVNPARTFGPDVVTALLGGEVTWSLVVVHWVGALAGGAAAVHDFVARSRTAETADAGALTPTSDADA